MNIFQRLWYGAFVNQRWTIGIARDAHPTDPEAVRGGRLQSPLHFGNFLADPFVVPGTAGRVLLCEWMQWWRGRGVIARVEFDEHGRIAEIAKLIDWAPYHLSYPHVFKHDGQLFCAPEACYSNSVRLFRLSADARTILGSQVLLDGFPAVDPTLFEFDGRWWLFCTRAGQSNSHLYAFHSDALFGQWKAHKRNPIVIDRSSARPAGRVFCEGGRLFRPAQDCSERYGGGLRLMEIERLTPDEYVERTHWLVEPPLGAFGRHGVHTLNFADGTICYDAYTEKISPLGWLYRLRERYR